MVVAVAGQRRQVDPADEGDLVVDDHDLLVVAVQRPRAGLELGADPGAADELVALGPDDAAARREHRDRRARPGEHPHRDALGDLAEQLAHRGDGPVRSGRNSGSRCHEQTWTWRRAPWIASAIAGSACAPSTSTSSVLPARGGVVAVSA